jgi:AcrR family transcriptional regulator
MREPPPRAQSARAEPVRRPTSRLPRAQRVEDIEAAARAVFTRRGYAAASIAEIAAEAGVAEGTIYKFFASKQHLVVRVIELWYGQMMAEFDKSLAGITGARNKIRFIVWRHLSALTENPELARLCANEVRNAGDYYQSELHELNRRYTHVFVEACREGVANGELRPDTPIALVRDLVFGGVEHHIAPMLYGKGSVEADLRGAADALVDTVLGGIQTPPAATSIATPEALLQRLDEASQRLEAAALRVAGGAAAQTASRATTGRSDEQR